MERTGGGRDSNGPKPESDIKPKDHHAPSGDDAHKTPKKRRKVNHGMACFFFPTLPFLSHLRAFRSYRSSPS